MVHALTDDGDRVVEGIRSLFPMYRDTVGARPGSEFRVSINFHFRRFYTVKYARLYALLFRGTVRAFTLPEVNCLLELAPQFTLPDPTHIGGLGFILM